MLYNKNKLQYIYIYMKLAKSNSPKIHKDFSLPKLQLKIMSNVPINQFHRLNFPRRDDSSLVAGVGRKHFSYNYSSVKKIINPQLRQDQINRGIQNYRSIGSDHGVEKVHHKQKIKNSLQNKLYVGDQYHPIYTEVAEAPFARDYHYKTRKQKTQVSQHPKAEKKQHFKLKTELDINFSKKMVTNTHQKQDLPKNYQSNRQKIQPKQSIQDHAHNINQSLLYKMYSTPEPMNLNKIQHRLYNPTYISSEF